MRREYDLERIFKDLGSPRKNTYICFLEYDDAKDFLRQVCDSDEYRNMIRIRPRGNQMMDYEDAINHLMEMYFVSEEERFGYGGIGFDTVDYGYLDSGDIDYYVEEFYWKLYPEDYEVEHVSDVEESAEPIDFLI